MATNFEEQCNRMNKFITIGKNRQNMNHAERVLKYFVLSMKASDPAFEKIYHTSSIAGSYADDIKVSAPDEFDFLITLRFPSFKTYSVRKSKPAHIVINANVLKENRQPNQVVVVSRVISLLDDNGFLSKSKLQMWIHQLLDKEFENLKKVQTEMKKPTFELFTEGYRYLIKRKLSGPAHTIHVEVKTPSLKEQMNTKFSIDMVPAVCLDDDRWVSNVRKFDQNMWKGKWHAIPKVMKDSSKGITDIDWICSYAEIERLYLKDTNKMKNIIRIFKKIRDNNNLATLKSYYIKTMFMWKAENVSSKQYWSQTNMETIFFEMFALMVQHVENKSLFFFWDKEYNMFEFWTQDQKNNLLGNLKNIQLKLLKAKENKYWNHTLPRILLTDNERIEYENAPINGARSSSSSSDNSFEIIETAKCQAPTAILTSKQCTIQ